MARSTRNTAKMEQISIRLPVEILTDLDNLKKRDNIDRSLIIVKALRYWVSVEGNVITDNEYLTQIKEMKNNLAEMKELIEKIIAHYEKESADNRTLLTEQQKTINTLLRMIPKED